MAEGYCRVGPAKCSCVGAYREGRDSGSCHNWVTPEKEAELSKIKIMIELTPEDVDDLLVRHKLTRQLKRKIADAQHVAKMAEEEICRSGGG